MSGPCAQTFATSSAQNAEFVNSGSIAFTFSDTSELFKQGQEWSDATSSVDETWTPQSSSSESWTSQSSSVSESWTSQTVSSDTWTSQSSSGETWLGQ